MGKKVLTVSNALWAFPDDLLGVLDGRSKEMRRDSLKKRGSESDVRGYILDGLK